MRIIGGEARGRPLQALEDRTIRPTLDRVREALFNILGDSVAGGHFLDLFAGTGANGLEALSRGAAAVTFVDHAAPAMALVRENLRRVGLEGQVTLLPIELPRDLGRIPGTYDIVFADPPYGFESYAALLEGLAAAPVLADESVVIIEHARRCALPEEAGLRRYRERKYGDTLLSFYQRE